MRIRILSDPILFSGRLTHAVIRSRGTPCRLTRRRPIRALVGVARRTPASLSAARAMGLWPANYRTPRQSGEIDLIGWSADALCL